MIDSANENGVEALKNVSLTINDGEIFGIIGMSGAGKSTLVRCINMLERPTDGTVIIDGTDLGSLSPKELRAARRKIAMIFQSFNLLLQRTCLQNVCFPLELAGVDKKTREKKAKHLAEIVGLGERIHAYPAQLSGGQKQRVGIARALANDPDILISDEATSALDPQTTDEVLDMLERINEKLNLTIVIITHEMHVIRKLADTVAVMENGQVIEEGPVAEVFTHPKKDLTKRFVNAEVDANQTKDTQSVVKDLLERYPNGQLIQLRFHGDQVETPVVGSIIRQFPGLELSILEGSIHQLADSNSTIGTLFIQLLGTKEDIDGAIRLFHELHVETKVIDHE